MDPDPQAPSADPSKYDPNKWSSYFDLFLGRMTPGDQLEFREASYIRNEARDVARCEADRNYLLKYSPTIRFLREQMQALNGDINEENVLCRRCPAVRNEEGRIVGGMSGGFNPEAGILICANQMRDRKHLEDTMAHEMVHAWDQLRWKVDMEGDLRHAACSEIRASALSGECRWTREFFTRGQWKFTQQHQNCVRMRAILSMRGRPGCKDDLHATKLVNEVWDSCYTDTRPFDEIYR